ncbi:spidroin-1-like isoform X2 [Passer domesticus]|uniref:spidroin-1-like isoform X2 n=1 Tax=Passer domesticus TaxID=48849 RepID=UPI0030FEEC1A
MLLIRGRSSEAAGLPAEAEARQAQGWERRGGSCGAVCWCWQLNAAAGPGPFQGCSSAPALPSGSAGGAESAGRGCAACRARPWLRLGAGGVSRGCGALIGGSGAEAGPGGGPRAAVAQQRRHWRSACAGPGAAAAAGARGGGGGARRRPRRRPGFVNPSLCLDGAGGGCKEKEGGVGHMRQDMLPTLSPEDFATTLQNPANGELLTTIGSVLGLVFLELGLGFYLCKKSS